MSPLEELLLKFYETWLLCESTRGCYSTSESHDIRCHKRQGIELRCTCGRDTLTDLDTRIDAMLLLRNNKG